MVCCDPEALSAASGQLTVATPLGEVDDGARLVQPEIAAMVPPLGVSKKLAVPVRPALPTGFSVMVALKTTAGDWLTDDGLPDEVRTSVVPAAPTVSPVVLLLPPKLVSLP